MPLRDGRRLSSPCQPSGTWQRDGPRVRPYGGQASFKRRGHTHQVHDYPTIRRARHPHGSHPGGHASSDRLGGRDGAGKVFCGPLNHSPPTRVSPCRADPTTLVSTSRKYDCHWSLKEVRSPPDGRTTENYRTRSPPHHVGKAGAILTPVHFSYSWANFPWPP
jgi:hypothetical protein